MIGKTVNGAYMFYGPNIPPISLSDKADFDGSSLYIQGIDVSTTVVTDVMFSDGGFLPVKPRKASEKCQTSCMSRKSASLAEDHESDDDDENERSGAEVENGSGRLFAFPNEGCVKTYQRYGSMVNHTLYGQCLFLS